MPQGKAQMLELSLKERLSFRLSGLSVSELQTAAGKAILFNAGANQVCAVRIMSLKTEFKTSIGTEQPILHPLKIQVIFDNQIGHLQRALFEVELARLGLIQERYSDDTPALSMFQNNGTVSGATFHGTIPADVLWPLS